MTTLQASLIRGNHASRFAPLPMPFYDASGNEIGEIVRVWFENGYTKGEVNLTEDGSATVEDIIRSKAIHFLP